MKIISKKIKINYKSGLFQSNIHNLFDFDESNLESYNIINWFEDRNDPNILISIIYNYMDFLLVENQLLKNGIEYNSAISSIFISKIFFEISNYNENNFK
jgi:hypothetical protein